MGKNKNRNRRKKKNASSVETKKALDEQMASPAVDCNCCPALKEEVSDSIKYTVGHQKICKTQSVSNFNQKSSSSSRISTNFKGNLSETNIMQKDGVCEVAETGKIVSGCYYSTKGGSSNQISVDNYARKAQLSILSNSYAAKARPNVQNDHAMKVQSLVESKPSRKIQPLMESNYAKDYPCMINNSVKNKTIIQNNKFPTVNSDETFNVNASTSKHKSSLESASSMNGTRPKIDTKQLKMSTLSNFNVSPSTKNIQNFKQHIQGSVRRNENHWEHFKRSYHSWKIERQNTIHKLQKLVEKVHKDQMLFNQGVVTLKEWNIGSREVKNITVSPTMDFFASLATFATDAASSVTSVFQACNLDDYTTMFKEIMKNDAEVTRPLYEARSQSLVEYREVEEIIRKCHSDTFGSTIGKISSTLKVEDLWLDIKNAKGENSVGQIIDSVDLFLRRSANVEKMGEVCNSIQGYLNSNPAALEACKYAGRALYDVFDTLVRDPKPRASIANNASIVTNNFFLEKDKKELNHLRSIADNREEIQTKLEFDILITIRSLEHELEEISNIFKESSHVHYNSPWY